MSSITPWWRRWRKRGSFTTLLESGDRGQSYRAVIRYRWRWVQHIASRRPLAPDALACDLLRRQIVEVGRGFRLLDPRAAENAMNVALCQEFLDDERAIAVQGRVRLRVPRSAREGALRRAVEEEGIYAADARLAVELNLLLERLADSSLGIAWSVDRYADFQFATTDPKVAVKSSLDALAELRQALTAGKADQITDSQLLVRHKIDDLFRAVENPKSLDLALEVANRMLELMRPSSPAPQTSVNGQVRSGLRSDRD